LVYFILVPDISSSQSSLLLIVHLPLIQESMLTPNTCQSGSTTNWNCWRLKRNTIRL